MPSLPAGGELLLPVGEHQGVAHRSLADFYFWNYQEASNKIIKGTPLISEGSAAKLKLHVLPCSVKAKQKTPTTLH